MLAPRRPPSYIQAFRPRWRTPLRRFALAIAISLALVVAAGAETAEKTAPQSVAELHLSFAPLVKKVRPAVVNVYASRVDKRPRNPLFDDPVFRQFFGDQGDESRVAQSLGSGVIVDPSGLVVTNHHVIDGMTDVKVALSDRREFPARIVLSDPRTDLAVLQIDAKEQFPVLELGDSDAIEVGDIVLAIGDPFGVGQTVTQGIVSALARTQIGINDYGFFIQTDAAINPGNSGGALVGLDGKLIGVNSAIVSRSGGSVGIGFAIPVNMVRSVIYAAEHGGVVKRPWLGASLQDVTKDIADSLGLARPAGALVADVRPDGPAAEAGLKRGDVLTMVDGRGVDDSGGVGFRLGVKPLGGTVTISALRDGKPASFELKLVAAPETPPRDAIRIKTRSPFQGALVENVSPAVTEDLSIGDIDKGVVVAEAPSDSLAANLGLQKGDVVLEVNGAKIATTRDLESAAAQHPRVWDMAIARGGQVIHTRIGG
ncbi:MAG: DegQ family serine endoprotease [Bradyrhizobium sp.]|nr:MAG: DegQ family serine endoprotease [Bradyrhizobium sp.]